VTIRQADERLMKSPINYSAVRRRRQPRGARYTVEMRAPQSELLLLGGRFYRLTVHVEYLKHVIKDFSGLMISIAD